jgi:hypothetical protein
MLMAAAAVRHKGVAVMKSKLTTAVAAAGCALALSVSSLLPSARSDTFTVSFPASVTVPEDGAIDHPVLYTLTNVSGNSLQTANVFIQISLSAPSGDPSDVSLGIQAIDFPTCIGTIANGASCTISLLFIVPDGTGEPDADFGQQTLSASFTFVDPGNVVVGSTGTLNTMITVTDPGFTAVPGPIAGAGLPGLIAAVSGLIVCWRRRKKIA